MIYGIAYDCPVGKRNNNCPFKGVSDFSFKEKIDWIEGLTKENWKAIVVHHMECSSRRENNLLSKVNL